MFRDTDPSFDRRSHRLARRLNAPTAPVEYDDEDIGESQELARQVAAEAQGLQGANLRKHLNRLRFPPPLKRRLTTPCCQGGAGTPPFAWASAWCSC